MVDIKGSANRAKYKENQKFSLYFRGASNYLKLQSVVKITVINVNHPKMLFYFCNIS